MSFKTTMAFFMTGQSLKQYRETHNIKADEQYLEIERFLRLTGIVVGIMIGKIF